MKNTEHDSTILSEQQLTSTAMPDPEVEEEVRRRAYQLYEQRGDDTGDPVSDWLQAEQEVRASINLREMKAAA